MSLKKLTFPFYQVKRGETLNTISRKFNVDATRILLQNKLAPKQIKEGVFLKIN